MAAALLGSVLEAGGHTFAASSSASEAEDRDYVALFLAILQTSAALTVFGALSIILYYLLNPSKRSFTLRLVVWLSLSNIGTSLGFFLQTQDNATQCIAAASIVTFFSVASFLWSCCIAFNLYWTTYGRRYRNHDLEPFYFAICILIPTACTVLPLVLDMYTRAFVDDGIGCWYKDEYSWARIVFFDGWIMLAWILNLVIYGFALKIMMMESLYIDQDPAIVQIALNNQRLVRSLLLNFVICWTWSIVLAALALAGVPADLPSTLWILVLFCVLTPLQGLLNFLSFLIKSGEFRSIYWQTLVGLATCKPINYDAVDTEEHAWAGRLMSRTVSINYGTYKDDMLAINS